MVSPAGVLLLGGQGRWSPDWLEGLGRFGPLLLGALAAGLVLRALAQDRRYRADGVLGADEQALVRAALARAEARTSGEIVPVVVERSDEHPEALWILGLVALLLGSALLARQLPWDSPALLLLGQAGLGVLGGLTGWWLPGLRRLAVSERRATRTAEERAELEFWRQGLHRTREGTGVLLFVSLLERRVIVLGDRGIHTRVGDEHWTRTTRAVLDGIARGSLREGLVAGIEACGAELAAHFPRRPDDRNELADRLIVRRR